MFAFTKPPGTIPRQWNAPAYGRSSVAGPNHSPALAPGALWVVSEFAIPNGWFGRLFAAPLISALYAAFRLLTGLRVRQLPDHGAGLREAAFRLVESRSFLRGLLVGQIWIAE